MDAVKGVIFNSNPIIRRCVRPENISIQKQFEAHSGVKDTFSIENIRYIFSLIIPHFESYNIESPQVISE